jgi:ABC-2 type transport system permease protein
VCAVTILGGLALLSSSFLFITQGTFTPIGVISELREYTKYPIDIFGSVMQFVFSWVIPIGYVSYYPSIFLLGYPSASYFYAGFVATMSFLIGYAAFHYGLRYFNGVSA